MPLYIAFLRAINVGGRFVKMEQLRQLFEGLDFANVETFITSGNVLFETTATTPQALEKKIEATLAKNLGYNVATFLRTKAEVLAVARHPAFPQPQLDQAQALNIAFLKTPLDKLAQQKLMTFKTEIDDFSVNRREVYWLCHHKQSESKFSNAVLEKSLGVQATLRGINTINKLVAKYF